MGTKLRAAALAGFLGTVGAVTGAAVAPSVASAATHAPNSCCIRYGYGPWFSGPTQVTDCQAYGDAHLASWDGYHCETGTGTHTGQTEVVFWLIIS